jgi:hypothetical protein
MKVSKDSKTVQLENQARSQARLTKSAAHPD